MGSICQSHSQNITSIPLEQVPSQLVIKAYRGTSSLTTNEKDQQEQERKDQEMLEQTACNQTLDIEYICDQLEERYIYQQLQNNETNRLLLNDCRAQEQLKSTNDKIKISISQNLIERMRYNYCDLPMTFRSLYQFAKKVYNLVFFHIEQGVKALYETPEQIDDKELSDEILFKIVKIQQILKFVCLEGECTDSWWTSFKNLRFDDVEYNKSPEKFTFQIEQDLIKLSGKIKREIFLNHKLIMLQFQAEHQKINMFRYRGENTQAMLKKLVIQCDLEKAIKIRDEPEFIIFEVPEE